MGSRNAEVTGELGESVAAIPPHFSDPLVPEPSIFPNPGRKKLVQRLPMNQTLAPRDLALCGPLSQVVLRPVARVQGLLAAILRHHRNRPQQTGG